jgi:hypothetical protein
MKEVILSVMVFEKGLLGRAFGSSRGRDLEIHNVL